MKGQIPEHAERVFKGILFDVYQWEQKMLDGTIQTYEGIKRLGSSQVIAITPEKKIILLKEEQPLYGEFISLPGGHIERDETPQENAEKELMEEAGIKAGEMVPWMEGNLGTKIDWPTFFFIARNCEKVSKPTYNTSEEKIETYEVSFEEFIKEVERDDFRNKYFQMLMFQFKNTEGGIERLRKKLFAEE